MTASSIRCHCLVALEFSRWHDKTMLCSCYNFYDFNFYTLSGVLTKHLMWKRFFLYSIAPMLVVNVRREIPCCGYVHHFVAETMHFHHTVTSAPSSYALTSVN